MDEVLPAIRLLEDRTELRVVDLETLPLDEAVDFIVIPGGSCDLAVVHAGLHALLQKTLDAGGLIAGICNGAVVMASAGILRGRRCTHTAHPMHAPRPQFNELLDFAETAFAGSHYTNEDLTIDGNLITAKPQFTEDFARAIAQHLGIKH